MPTNTDNAAAKESEQTPLFIVDLGEQSKKSLKKLKKGRGKLLTRIEDVLAQVAKDENVPKGATPVFLVKKEATGLAGLFASDDD